MYSPSSPLSAIEGGMKRCLRFKYFLTFVLCTTCLALLTASLTTHKWIVSKPIRSLRVLHKGDNFTILDESQFNNGPTQDGNAKFHGDIHFGLFKGIKVLNYGFGDRISVMSVQSELSKGTELITYRLWIATLASVSLSILFGLLGTIFAIINFVMSPNGTFTGPLSLIIWNALSGFFSLTALVCWTIEYFSKLQKNVLTMEEVQNGWTSESRSQFGYSYYFVVVAFVLFLVNIFIVSLVQFDDWTANKKRAPRTMCEGVVMLY